MNHQLKIKAQYFAHMLEGAKTAEIRSIADRDFQAGDTITYLVLVADGSFVYDRDFVIDYVDSSHVGLRRGYALICGHWDDRGKGGSGDGEGDFGGAGGPVQRGVDKEMRG